MRELERIWAHRKSTNISLMSRTSTRTSTSDVAPRLLTRSQAAAYCSISVATFTVVCDVRPIALGPSKRLERFDTRALDAWIDALAEGETSSSRDWLAAWESKE